MNHSQRDLRRSSPRAWSLALVGAGLCGLALMPPALAQPDGGAPQPVKKPAAKKPDSPYRQAVERWNAFKKTVREQDPETRLASYIGYHRKNAGGNAAVLVRVVSAIATLESGALNNPERAIEALDWGLEKYATESASLGLVDQKLALLLDLQRLDEAEALMGRYWDRIVTSNAAGLEIMKRYDLALRRAGRQQETLALLQRTLLQQPDHLNASPYDFGGQLTAMLFYKLQRYAQEQGGEKQRELAQEALSWAKLRFVLCAVDGTSIGRAVEGLQQAWAMQPASRQGEAAQFLQAQKKDSTVSNPLSEVALPAIDRKAWQKRRGNARWLLLPLTGEPPWLKWDAATEPKPPRLRENERALHELVTASIVLGRLGEGMELASVYAQQYPDAAAGPLEVARLFKAADLNLSRANAYLRFRKGKTDVDPVPPFLLEQQKKEQTAPATPATAPVAEPQDATVAPVTDDEQTPEPEREPEREPEATDEAAAAEVRP